MDESAYLRCTAGLSTDRIGYRPRVRFPPNASHSQGTYMLAQMGQPPVTIPEQQVGDMRNMNRGVLQNELSETIA
jgi:hypothetical protein